jgi:hypothetical protein
MTKIVRKIIQKRPSLDVEFFTPTDEVISRLNEYAAQGKSEPYKSYISSDGLEKTIELVFNSLDYFAEMGNETLMLNSSDKRHLYCEKHNICYKIEEKEIEE